MVDHHILQRIFNGSNLRAAAFVRRQRGALGLDQSAGTNQFERTGFGGQRRIAADPGAGVSDVDTRAHAYLDIAFDFQSNQRFAHRRAADTELGGQVTLWRQPLTRLEFTTFDQRRDLVGNLAVETAVFDGLDGHRVCSAFLLRACMVQSDLYGGPCVWTRAGLPVKIW